MNPSGFMHKYYDWALFEQFVQNLYEGDGDVCIQRDITDTDRYGARRQTDVKIIRRSRFHQFVTLVECKRWKEPVSRDRIDVLASSIEALGATNGAIFTTTGFEEGAIAYAKGKGIELFVVRDLTREEWGLPGRHVHLFLHVNAAELHGIQFAAQAILLVDEPPSDLNLGIELSQDKVLDPDFDLFSVKTGERGPNLAGLLGDAHRLILSSLCKAIGVIESGKTLTLEIQAISELDFSKTEFCQLRLPAFAARIEKIGFTFIAHISQSEIKLDRGADLDFAVMVESYVSDQRLIARRKAGDLGVTFQNAALNSRNSCTPEDVLQNGSLMRVLCAPWVGLGGVTADRTGLAGQLIKVFVEPGEGKPRLSLVAEPLQPATVEVGANQK